jgi:hypothetical protein
MITDKSKKRVIDLDDEDIDDARRSRVLPDGHTLRVPLMMMDSDPTGLGLTPDQKQAFCDAINRGYSFDRALDIARSPVSPDDIRFHRPGFHGDAAMTGVQASYDKRVDRLSNAWRDGGDLPPVAPKPVQPAGAFTSDSVVTALDKRNARLTASWRDEQTVNGGPPVFDQRQARPAK